MDAFFLTKMVVWYIVFLFSTTLHEAMHSYAASYAGDKTAYEAGTATLNPIPHMQRSKFGMIVVPLLSFVLQGGSWMIGWASAPFNPYWAARYPKRSFVMSLAGPLSHLPAVLISFFAMYIGLHTGFFTGDLSTGMVQVTTGNGGSLSWALSLFLNAIFTLNIVLLVFNLLPIPPLDGSEFWYLFVKREEDRLRFRYHMGSYAVAGIVLAWWLFPRVFIPVYSIFVMPLIRVMFQ